MGFTGRIGLLIFTVVSFVVWHFAHGLRFDIFNVFLMIFFGILSWVLGIQYDKAKYFSEKDTLTRVYNRRFVEAIFPKILAQVERNNEQLSLSIIDCNDFKPINDTYGHKIGDEVLITLSSLLSGEIRKSDIVARWGGDF
ncbi:GGDEF domain-containing protein [Ammoniphilus sp. 3BR4]